MNCVVSDVREATGVYTVVCRQKVNGREFSEQSCVRESVNSSLLICSCKKVTRTWEYHVGILYKRASSKALNMFHENTLPKDGLVTILHLKT